MPYMIISFNDQSKVTNRVRNVNELARSSASSGVFVSPLCLSEYIFFLFCSGVPANSRNRREHTRRLCPVLCRSFWIYLCSVIGCRDDGRSNSLLTAVHTNKIWGNQFVDLTLYNADSEQQQIYVFDWPTANGGARSPAVCTLLHYSTGIASTPRHIQRHSQI